MALKLLEKRMVESNTTNLLAPLTSLSLAHQSKLLAEALKHAFSLRMSLGDQMTDDGTLSASQLEMNAKIEDALNAMLSDNFTMQLAPELEAGPLNLDEYGGDFNLIGLPDDSGTTHFSIVDASGSAVGVTSTINTEFGSKVRSPNTGIILNNEMDDFSLPGQSNTYGIPPSEANYIQPFKRPLSSMSPTIVLDSQERIVAVVGGSGGPRIITGTFQTIVRLLLLGMDPLTAIQTPRLHHQLVPDELKLENYELPWWRKVEWDGDVVQELAAMNYTINEGSTKCVIQLVHCQYRQQQNGQHEQSPVLTGVSDPRKAGWPAGY
mmetsp:Transcript_4486/g.16090  ORF Transcript_4486/g.16090 Transcript_4486/m.16090 type:complete len:322 (+) Transcript_4486:1257-2222(+)